MSGQERHAHSASFTPIVSNRATAHFCLNCRSHKTLVGRRAHADRRNKLFIPGQPLFIPGQPLFIYDNRLFIRSLLIEPRSAASWWTRPRQSRAVSPLRLSAPFRDTKPHRRESPAHPRAVPRVLRGSNSPTRRWGTGLDRRRNTGRGPRISTFRDEPSQGFLPRRLTEHTKSDLTNRWVDQSVAKV
jgi:hypothetical protein